MKRINLLFLVFVMFITSCTTPPEAKKQTLLQYYSPYQAFPEFLHGQIKSVKEVTYAVVDNDGVLEKGELYTKEDRKNNSWSLDFICYFNEEGLLIKSVRYNGEEKGNIFKLEYENGLLSKTVVKKQDTIRWHHIFKNDENGHLSGFKVVNVPKDSVAWYGDFECNADGFIIKQLNYNSDKELVDKYSWTLDESNLTLEIIGHNDADSLIYKVQKSYNEKGFYILSQTFENNEVKNTLKMEYTNYDEMGNWLSKTAFRNDTAITICERVYEYY